MLAVFLVGAAVLHGCQSARPARRGALDSCQFNDQCESPLICAARRCRAACRSDRDCANGWRCLSSGQESTHVCYAPDDYANACLWDSQCRGGRICGGDRICRAQCLTDYDCAVLAPGLRCLASGVCSAHPFLDDAGSLVDVDLNLRDAAPGHGDDGLVTDAGVPVTDAGVPVTDAGVPVTDAGVPVTDAGVPVTDAGVPTTDTGMTLPVCSGRAGGCIPGRDPGCGVLDVVIDRSTCALMSDGVVRCWGLGHAVGNGSTTPCPLPGVVPGVTGATELAIGSDFACTRRTGDPAPIWCWGVNGVGQLGRGGVANGAPQPSGPATLLPDGPVVLGANFGFVLTAPGVWWAFGSNRDGVFGNGTTQSAVTVPTEVRAPGAIEVCAGAAHACARYLDGQVRCWGRNDFAQLGTGTRSTAVVSTPTPVAGVTNATAIRANVNQTCALRGDGSVWCWGRVGTRYEAPTALTMGTTPLTDAEALWLSYESTCVRRVNGQVWCRGANVPGAPVSSYSLVRAPGIDRARSVRFYPSRGCVLGEDQTLRCWGAFPGVDGVMTATTPTPVTW